MEPTSSTSLTEINALRPSILLSSIVRDNRQRELYEPSAMEKLCQSIQLYGLIHPVALEFSNDGQVILIAGGRRTMAMEMLGITKLEYGKHYLPKESIPEYLRKELEWEENFQREDITWQEKVHAIRDIHESRERQAVLNPEQTLRGNGKWGLRETASLLGLPPGSQTKIGYSVTISKLIKGGDKDVEKCENLSSAIDLLLQRKEDELNKALVGRLKAASPATGVSKQSSTTSRPLPSLLPIEVDVNGDFEIDLPTPSNPTSCIQSIQDAKNAAPATSSVLNTPSPTVESPSVIVDLSSMIFHSKWEDKLSSLKGQFDHIICDPPYAIEMNNLQQTNVGMDVSRMADNHVKDENIAMLEKFIPAAYEATPEKAFCVMFCDEEWMQHLRVVARKAGWATQRWALWWVKESRCQNLAADYNFTKATECAIVLRKTSTTLVEPQARNWYQAPRESSVSNTFAKPLGLWNWIAKAVALKGQTILDPFMGEASSGKAFIVGGYNYLGIEEKEIHYNAAFTELSSLIKRLNPGAMVK